ncbi:hypothetical protein [Mycolicibacterium sarraceniae]|uniref:Uncharacterized protein n=1 Tax=Mycolicibacterium sarraceniae TaxID=1534348 RepID=A0A7I7SWA0_9MYCO|nr:hypothetical protein [Mycolicibacterium sarraceniae]BBY60315.1 hypothetical protein MSAR_34510 [Mycolicibacterium sarraceniae]
MTMTTGELLTAVANSTELIDTDHKVAAALAAGTTVVDGVTARHVNDSIAELIFTGYVESVSFIPCDHPAPDFVEPEDSLCGHHLLRFGTVTVPWSYCRQTELVSIAEACVELDMTEAQLIAVMVADGLLIEHPNGGYIPSPHPAIAPLGEE